MSHQVSPSSGGVGRTALWVTLALTVLLLGYVMAVATRANPIYSDRNAYGISKYRLIEECREHLFEPDNLPLTLGPGQTQSLTATMQSMQALKAGQKLLVESTAEPKAIDDGVLPDANGNLNFSMPVMVKIRDTASGFVKPFAPLMLQCSYNKAEPNENKRLNVMLVPSGG